MKIESQPNREFHTSPIKTEKQQTEQKAAVRISSGNFDGIMIQAGQLPSQEELFVASVSSRLSMELKKPENPGQILDLQQQIDDGRYQIDVAMIADRIMYLD